MKKKTKPAGAMMFVFPPGGKMKMVALKTKVMRGPTGPYKPSRLRTSKPKPAPPIDLSLYEWSLEEQHQRPPYIQTDPDTGDERRYFYKMPHPCITVVIDDGETTRKYRLFKAR